MYPQQINRYNAEVTVSDDSDTYSEILSQGDYLYPVKAVFEVYGDTTAGETWIPNSQTITPPASGEVYVVGVKLVSVQMQNDAGTWDVVTPRPEQVAAIEKYAFDSFYNDERVGDLLFDAGEKGRRNQFEENVANIARTILD